MGFMLDEIGIQALEKKPKAGKTAEEVFRDDNAE